MPHLKKKQGGSTNNCDPSTEQVGTVENNIVNQPIIPTSDQPKPSQGANIAIHIISSGASNHYDKRNAEQYCSKVVDTITPNLVKVANGKEM